MALPTMNGYWSSRKNIYEQAIVRHRDHEDDFRSKWGDTARYFKNSDARAAKQQAWSSTGAFQERIADEYQESVERDVKASNLKRRRDKLASLFKEENAVFTAKLRGLSVPNSSRLEEMKMRADDLKSAREEKRQKLAQDKLYEHWRENNLELRKAESEMLQGHVVRNWENQKIAKQKRLESAKQENLEFDREMEKERQAALLVQRQKEEEKLQEDKSIRDVLKEQIYELKAREDEAAQFKRQQDLLLTQRWEIERIEESQRHREEERRKKDLGRALLRQHKAQMMNKSRLIQKELEQDQKLLESLIDKEVELNLIQTSRREKAKADAAWMKEVLDEQLKLEKAREAELDMLYQDEAARMWHKREGEWERERQARQRLMAEVLESRAQQIGGRLEELRQQQEASMLHREQLLQELEAGHSLTRREEEERERDKQLTRATLEEQIYSKKASAARLAAERTDELQAEREEERGYEDLLNLETQRMKLDGFTPRNHGRSRQAWM